MFLTLIEGFMEVELMVTKRDDDDRQPTEYRAICLWKVGRQSFAIVLDFRDGKKSCTEMAILRTKSWPPSQVGFREESTT